MATVEIGASRGLAVAMAVVTAVLLACLVGVVVALPSAPVPLGVVVLTAAVKACSRTRSTGTWKFSPISSRKGMLSSIGFSALVSSFTLLANVRL